MRKKNLQEVIDETGDDELFQVVTDYLFKNVCRNFEAYRSYSKRMTTGHRLVILMRCLSAEAANGGIHQFLSNSSGDETEETIEHLKSIGAFKQVEAFEIISRVVFGGTIPKSRGKRNRLLAAFEGDEKNMSEHEFEDSIEKSEDFFSERDQSFGWCEEIKELTVKYIRETPEEFECTDAKPIKRPWWILR